jgi:hypothetical protein
LSDDDDFDNLMPPTRDQHEKKYGDTLVGQYSDRKSNQNDEEPPKPTADVLMSRNLRGGVQKGFNFAFSDDDDSPSPQRNNRSLDDEDD